ncbi:hypothetical protein [Rossellomorea aquimaris]|uniref:Uncharacterized protein n=1 Tax=Rossellomorea aquimaris TaxID=189382 RepID=A0A366EH97_9BACI|nr:hypothetical protein [Rossellomorea aquimaris]RBP01100.1 hypothetical protein DET59_1218 [Rossellomorea aquimaris]
MLKKIIKSLLGSKRHGYSSSDAWRKHKSPKHKHFGHQHYKKHKSKSFFSSFYSS